jgi:hypothetical protein
LRSAKGGAEKPIGAAILKHVYGMSNMDIAREMGQFAVGEQKDKNDSATVCQWVRLGRQLLKRVLPEYRRELHARNMKADAERWNDLTEKEQKARRDRRRAPGHLRHAGRGHRSDEDLDRGLAEFEEKRRTAECELVAIKDRRERIELLERDKDQLLHSYAKVRRRPWTASYRRNAPDSTGCCG